MKNIVTLLLCAILGGCAFSHHSHLSSRGAEVPPLQATQIQPGVTDKQWILDNLGTPDRIYADQDGLEIYEYVRETTEKIDSDFILLFSVETEKVVETIVTRIVMRDGVVESIDTTGKT